MLPVTDPTSVQPPGAQARAPNLHDPGPKLAEEPQAAQGHGAFRRVAQQRSVPRDEPLQVTTQGSGRCRPSRQQPAQQNTGTHRVQASPQHSDVLRAVAEVPRLIGQEFMFHVTRGI